MLDLDIPSLDTKSFYYLVNILTFTVMTWARDLSHDVAYSFYPRCDLILTNSAHLFKRYHPQTYRARAYEVC